MEKVWPKLLNEIWYAKISPLGFFNGLEIVMYPNYDFVFTELPCNKKSFSQKGDHKNFDFKAFELFLKEHVKNKPNQICFPKSCWKLKGQSKQTEEWANSPTIEIRTNTRIGEGSHYPLPENLLKIKGEKAFNKVDRNQEPSWMSKWRSSRSYKKRYGSN